MTPSELLFHCLEDFAKDEAQEAIVIYTTVGGDIAWPSTLRARYAKLGILEHVIECVREDIRQARREASR